MSVAYYGDYSEDETVYIPFNTFDSNDPTASVTITDLVDADLKVHKDGNTTEIATDGATIAINFDSITGNHLITIDTSVDAAYSTGSDYFVRMEGTTVDAGTINAWVGIFSIENRHAAAGSTPPTVEQIAAEVWDTLIASHSGGTTFGGKNQLVVPSETLADYKATGFATSAKQDTMETTLDDIPNTAEFEARSLLAAAYTIVTDLGTVQTADHTAAIADIPTVAEFNARTIVAANYLEAGDTLARVTLVDTVTANTDLVSAAAIKTAMEADNSDLDFLVTDLINKKTITILSGNTEQFDDSNVSIGTIVTAYSDDGTDVERKRMAQTKP